jgi:hypothetical protein
MIFFSKSAQIKSFLSSAGLSTTAEHYLTRLIIAFLLHWGRMTASQAAYAVRIHPRHRANVARFLAKAGLGANWLECFTYATVLLEQEYRREGIWLFILDETCCSQQGSKTENTFSTGNRQRRPQKGRRHSKKRYTRKAVHAFVVGLLITPGGLRLPHLKCYLTKDYAAQKKVPHRTQAQLGADLIRAVKVPESARVVVLGDTAYEAQVVRQACDQRQFTWIVPMNPERVLAGPQGQRPKIRSFVLAQQPDQFVPVRLHPSEGAFVEQRRLSRHRVGSKVKSRTYYVHTETRAVHSVGTVQVVASCLQKPSADKPIPLAKVLITNDRKLKTREILALYSLRWQIELFFKELKSSLGMHQYRFRQFEKVAAWVQAALLAFVYLEWLRAKKLRDGRLDAATKRWWQRQRTHGLCRAVRLHAEQKELVELNRYTETSTGIEKLRKILHQAQPLEYRQAC